MGVERDRPKIPGWAPRERIGASMNTGDTIPPMRKPKLRNAALILIGLIIAALALYQIPAVERRVSWQVEVAMAYVRGVIDRVGGVPTAKPAASNPNTPLNPATTTPSPAPTSTPLTPAPTATSAPSPTPLPQAVSLPAPAWERQDINNCGPASLAMYLRFYGWGGDQL